MDILSSRFVMGVRGTDPIVTDGRPQIAFVGRSNVGKSSVINSLVGKKDLVKTGKKPGKTTEINFFAINDEFYFVDLPGYGYASGGAAQSDMIRKMIVWYLSESGAKPSMVMLILDIKVGITDFDSDMLDILREEQIPYSIVANKADKLTQKEVAAQVAQIKKKAKEGNVLVYSTVKKSSRNVILDALTV